MKTYKTQQEIEADIKDRQLKIDGDVKFECNFEIEANITAKNITAKDIRAWNITAKNITAKNITAGDINFYAICFACVSFKCNSIIGRRENAKYVCLDSDVQITKNV